MALFILATTLGAIGFSSILTLVNAIALNTKNSASMSVILGFPILLPQLMISLKLSKFAIDGLSATVYSKYLLSLGLLDLAILVLALLLFPYLWRD
jgi:heme exporter protein B